MEITRKVSKRGNHQLSWLHYLLKRQGVALGLLFLLDLRALPAPQGSESPRSSFPVSWTPPASQSPLDFWALDSSGPLGLVLGDPLHPHPSASGPPAAKTFIFTGQESSLGS